jgi:hypothetical protein
MMGAQTVSDTYSSVVDICNLRCEAHIIESVQLMRRCQVPIHHHQVVAGATLCFEPSVARVIASGLDTNGISTNTFAYV